ncbi:hypothetical protein TZ86_00232 [Streptococcus gordonii]|uniref:Uncharacterized protein n=1 Tax=Streptococcus gordonii TaxID=1302 RepID=A0AAW3H5U3_STRGN|nr:hypothetical protein TZ86_00232 [Streptococcus gordonii]
MSILDHVSKIYLFISNGYTVKYRLDNFFL